MVIVLLGRHQGGDKVRALCRRGRTDGARGGEEGEERERDERGGEERVEEE